MSQVVTSILLAHRAKAGDIGAMVEIVEACWRDQPHLTAKQVCARIRNSTGGKLSNEFVRNGIMKFLEINQIKPGSQVGVIIDDPNKSLRKDIGEAVKNCERVFLKAPGTLGENVYKNNSYEDSAKGCMSSATPEGATTENGDDAASEVEE